MSCHHPNSPFHAFCVECGLSLDRLRCSRCGTANETHHLFCFACGLSLRSGLAEKHTPALAIPTTYDLDALCSGLENIRPTAEESLIRLSQNDIMNLVKAKLQGNL
jgi:hypothetical protein